MSDELNKIRAAMDAAIPIPDPDKRAENLVLAQKNFDKLQGSRTEPRPTTDRRPIGWLTSGVAKMFQSISTRGALTATTALVAFGLIVVWPQGRDLLSPPPVITVGNETPVQSPSTVQPVEFGRGDKANEILGKTAETLFEEAEIDSATSNDVLAGTLSDQDLSRSRIQSTEQSAVSGLAAPVPASPSRLEATVYEDPNTEAFANAAPASLKITAEEPVSTFSIDVDTASYAVVRSSLMAGFLPPPEAVRIEEMVNYFPYDYAAPDADEAPFRQSVSLMTTPWNPNTQLVHIALQGQMPAVETRPPLNLVFLIDTSGSMQDADKLPLLKQSFKLMLGQLSDQDSVAIVTYAGSAGQVLEATRATERSKILAALDNLEAGGSTAGQAGLQQAYAVAEDMAEDGEVTRVILATDGDFNVGLSGTDELKDFIADKRDTGTYLSVLGFGRGNLDDATMQALAQNGNGQAAYIDTLVEAQKVLVDQLTGALFPIANDVKIQVEFNPATIAEYRLIGYETRALAREDFNNDKVDAGEIGAGLAVTALYEITPVGSAAVLNDPLRYGAETSVIDSSGELGFLRLRYKEPGQSVSQLIETPINADTPNAGTEAQFAAAIAGFGQLLRGSDYLGDWSWDDAVNLANGAQGDDTFGYRREAINLMRLAESLSK